MRILKELITIAQLEEIARSKFGGMVKAVVDIDRQLVAVDAELHSDLEALMFEDGSKQSSLWGINFYPDIEGDDFIEFDSLINLRPSQGNKTRGVDSEDIRKRIVDLVNRWVKR